MMKSAWIIRIVQVDLRGSWSKKAVVVFLGIQLREKYVSEILEYSNISFINFLIFLVSPQHVLAAKRKISSDTLDVINRNFEDAMRHKSIESIDIFGRSIRLSIGLFIYEVTDF